MSNLQMRHPDEGALLRFLDGELPAGQARQVERHLEACWQCRAEVEELQAGMADCVRYRKNVLGPLLPPPPNPWPDLHRELDRIDRSLADESWLSRLLGALARPAVRRWSISAAAAALVAFVIFYQLRQTPSVQAAVLLKRAVAAAESRPVTPHRIRFRTRTVDVIRLIGVRRAATAEPAVPELYALFQIAHYDWNDPLSARAFAQWRDLLRQKTDVVAASSDSYRIRTETPEGDVEAASLTMRATDFHPVEGKLEFRNREWVEFTEIADAATEDNGNTVAANVELPPRRADPSRSVAPPPGPTASISDEVQVLAALHGIGADLGETLEIKRSGGSVLVSGVGITPARQRQIRGALDGLPNVVVQFTDPAPAPLPDDTAAVADAVGATPPAIAIRLERQLGGRPEFERFSSRMLDWNEAAMSRAYALRSLARRFPAETEPAMSPADLRIVKDLSREHTAALAKTVADMNRAMAPVLVSMGGSPAQAQPPANAVGWQSSAEDVLRASRRVEVLLSVMLGATPNDGPTDTLPSDLLAAMSHLQAELDQCRRLLAQE